MTESLAHTQAQKLLRAAAVLMLSLAALGASTPGRAAIAPGTAQSGSSAAYSGNGELFLSVFDPTVKVSYTLDLGETLNDFFVWGQQDTGNQRFWEVADERWAAFLPQVNRAALRWAVLGFDATGGTALGGIRHFSTVQQGDEAKIATMTNQALTNGTGSTQAGTFFNAVNTTGSHGAAGVALDFTVQGSSVNADPEPGNSYFGDGGVGLTPTLNGNAPFNNSNPVGKSSWFYYLTRSGTVQSNPIAVDEFDNLGYDGYWGFVYVDPALYPDSPHRSTYLLSYTLSSFATTLQQREFAAGIGRTESSGGFAVARLPGVAAASFEVAAGWTSRLGGLTGASLATPMAAVPEPATWAMTAAGLLVLGALARGRRR